MKKSKILFCVLPLVALFFGFLGTRSVSAVTVSEYITGVTVKQFASCPSGTYWGGTTDSWGYRTCYADSLDLAVFDVNLSFGGSKCAGGKCSDAGYWWRCNNHDKWSGSAGYSGAYVSSMEWSWQDDNYDYYKVLINSGNGSYQNVLGYVRVERDKSKTLTAYAIDTNGTLLNGGNRIDYDTVTSGSSASVDKTSITGYDYKGWKTSTTATSYAGTGNTYTVSSLTSDTDVYAVYQIQRKTLTLKSVDINGNSLSSVSGLEDKTTTVDYGSRAEVTRGTSEYYIFKGFKVASSAAATKNADWVVSTGNITTRSGGSGGCTYISGCPIYYISSLTANGTVYAVYELVTFDLSLTVDNHSWGKVYRTDSPFGASKSTSSPLVERANTTTTITETVYKNDVIKIEYGSDDCYDITTGTINGTSYSSGSSYTVTEDTAVVVGSTRRKYTLTGSTQMGANIWMYRDNGSTGFTFGPEAETNTKKDIYCGEEWDTTFRLSSGYSWGNYSRSSWSYSFNGVDERSGHSNRSETGPATDDYSNSPYSVNDHETRGNITVQAKAVRNKFQGLAQVAEGTKTWDESTNKASTGWKEDDGNVSITMECPDDGCTASFWLRLKTVKGTGSTGYRIGVSKNGGSVSWLPSASTQYLAAPNTTKTVLGTSASVGLGVTLYPGESRCYYLKFKPYGALSNDTYKTVSACVTAKESTFEGKSDVSGAVSDTTGWKNTTTNKVAHIADCSPTAGCNVSFAHSLKRTSGIGSTNYSVSRTVNYISSLRAIKTGMAESDSNVANGTFRPSTDTSGNNRATQVSSSGAWTLYPGAVVCERLTFKPTNNTVNVASNVTLTICASAEGSAQPDDPGDPNDPGNPNIPDNPQDDPNGDEESDAFINMEVKNNSVAKYNTYRRMVYAKPGDSLSYRGTYNPILQYSYYIIPQKMQINGGTVYTNSSALFLYQMFNLKKSSSLRNWNNATTIFSSNFTGGSFSNDYVYTNGSTSKRRETNGHTVYPSEVGRSLDGTNQTNPDKPTTTKTTPSQVSFYPSGDYNVGNVITTQLSSTAYARVPYNFNSKIDTPDDGPDPTIPAGEEKTVRFPVEVVPKTNCETTDKCTGDGAETYSTKIPEARRRVIVYDPDAGGGGVRGGTDSWGSSKDDELCSYFGLSNNETSCGYARLTENDKDIATTGTTIQATFYAQDKRAGSRICIAAAIYPSNSGADTNWNDKEGNHRWRISESTCYTIAKKPNFEVWGGNIYSAGNIRAAVSVKNNLYGYTSYSVGTKNSNSYVFGSWGELGVISAGSVTGLASGATTGFSEYNPLWPSYNPANGAGNNTGAFASRNPGGSLETTVSLCRRSVLTFMNYPCGTTAIGGLGNSKASRSSIENNEQELINSLVKNNSGSDKLELTEVARGGEVGGVAANDDKIRVFHSEGDIKIVGNMTYNNSGYTKFSEIPKNVVYAKGDITISCGVSRLDALLIAEGKVTTCDSDDINASVNSTQLYVYGAIVANSLKLNRTYGAATGANSMIPAEIVNFDPTLYLFGDWKADGGGSVDMTTTYLNEVSPRL